MADDPPNTTLPQTTTSKTADIPQLDESFYTWRTYFSIISGFATDAELRKYKHVRDVKLEESDCKRCESQRDWLFQYSPIVRFMRDNIQQLGADINPQNARCKRCTSFQAGGFDADYGILICANHMRNKGHLEDTLAHEMVHAWDYLRFKVDRRNLRHAACTEIRASTLSGECRFMREFFTRGQRKITQQMQECVRRRATLSLMNRPNCKDDVHAAKVVNEVWDSCFTDTRPFDEIYR